MAQISFFARGDGSSANNANLNIENTNTQPTVLLTFDSGATGDLIFESNGGSPDPDTTVVINGTEYNFTVELVGVLPIGHGKVPDPLEGKTVAIISVVINGQTERFFFVTDGSGTQVLMDEFGGGAVTLGSVIITPPPFCFCAGTSIATPSGLRNVERLRAGDLVLTSEGCARQVIWVGSTRISAEALLQQPHLRPILIRAGSFGFGAPTADLYVSPQHRLVVRHSFCELLFAEEEVLVAAKFLVGSLAEVAEVAGDVEYVHVLLQDHEILLGNGLASESFQPTRRMIDVMGSPARARLEAVIDTLDQDLLHRKDSLRSLRHHEAMVLMNAIDRSDRAVAGISQFKNTMLEGTSPESMLV
jgi:hypothetical protein